MSTTTMTPEVSAGEQPPAYRRRTSSTSWIFQLPDGPFIETVDKYLEKEAANSKVARYLRTFLDINHCCKLPGECRAVFNIVSQLSLDVSDQDRSKETELRGHEKLQEYIEEHMGPENKSLSFCAIIAENICPYSMCLLGVVFDIKPRFWATHFEKSYHTQEADVDRWLLPLPSTSRERDVDSFNVQYVEPREVDPSSLPSNTMDTIGRAVRPLDGYKNYSDDTNQDKNGGLNKQLSNKTYSARVNREMQFLPPRPPATGLSGEEESKYPVAFIPGPLSVKRSESAGGATVMVVLIDPHPNRPVILANSHLDKDIDKDMDHEDELSVRKPRQRMSHFLSQLDDKTENVEENAYRNIGQMIARQWQLVHGYMYRDLDLIKRKLEVIPSFDTAEKILGDMFRHRQNCTQYNKQLTETMAEFKELMRGFHKSTMDRPELAISPGASDDDLKRLMCGFQQLSEATDRNIKLLTDLTAIKEAQQGLDENHGITRLTHIATLYLPFSTVAAVLAMPDGFAPGARRFWVYWVASAALSVLILVLVVMHRPLQSWWTRSQQQGASEDGLALHPFDQRERMNKGGVGVLKRWGRWRGRRSDGGRRHHHQSNV